MPFTQKVHADRPLALFFQVLLSGAMTSKATVSRNISWIALEITHIIFLGSPPEVGASCIAGNVEYSNSLEAGQRDRPPIALHRKEGDVTLSTAGESPSCQSTCSKNRKQPAQLRNKLIQVSSRLLLAQHCGTYPLTSLLLVDTDFREILLLLFPKEEQGTPERLGKASWFIPPEEEIKLLKHLRSLL